MKSGSIVPPGYISKLNLSHGTDTEHDIVVSTGFCKDDTDIMDMYLQNNITKRFDAEWSVGDTNGGMAPGEALPSAGTIHLWLIKRSDTGVVDVMANDNALSGLNPSLPANYDYKRRIFSLRTDASNNIINGDQWGTGLNRTFMYDTPILDVNNGTPGTNAVTAALSTPGVIVVRAILNAYCGSGLALLSWLSNGDVDPGNAGNPPGNIGYRGTQSHILTNTSSQIRYRLDANEQIYIATHGWEDAL